MESAMTRRWTRIDEEKDALYGTQQPPIAISISQSAQQISLHNRRGGERDGYSSSRRGRGER